MCLLGSRQTALFREGLLEAHSSTMDNQRVTARSVPDRLLFPGGQLRNPFPSDLAFFQQSWETCGLFFSDLYLFSRMKYPLDFLP